MTSAVSETPPGLRRIAIADGDVCYLAPAPLGADPEVLMQTLIAEVAWRSESIVLWGKRIAQPRRIAWYGDPGRVYTYSGLRLEPLPWSPVLADLREIVSALCGVRFDSVLLNYYRDHHDSMGMHSDDEPELGPCPVIGSVSLGEPRTFVMKHRDKAVEPLRLRLESGSLLIMRGETQRYWKHGIPKQTRACGRRVNLTFRRIEAARQ